MTSENSIYLKLENREALQLKKDLLSIEMGLLKTAKTIRNYGYFRSEEIKLKLMLYKKMREVKMNIGKLQNVLPKLKVPEILRKKKEIPVPAKPEMKKEIPHDDSLETQLQEIQNRLNELQREGI